MFEEFRLLDAAKRSAGENVSDIEQSAMQGAFARLDKATGKEHEKAFKSILKLQQEIEASARSELEIESNNLLFIEEIEQRERVREQQRLKRRLQAKR